MLVEELAAWAHDLTPEDVPDDVRELCRAQRRSVLGGIAASTEDPAAKRVVGAVERDAADGPARLLTTTRHARVEDALYAAAALSIALDYDDYLCFGHTGHTAVLVPLLLSAETASDGSAQLAAQVAVNEIAARLGGSCLIGPLNGQMWSHIHAAGAAVAGGMLLGLDRTQLAHALAISLYQPPRPTTIGFMAPDTKLLTAAESMVAGLRAARLARAGVTGPLDALDSSRGFFSAFAYAPLRSMFDGLGERWATRTLSVKPYPGCAYVDAAVDAFLELDIDASEIDRIEVRGGLLTCGMNALSTRYLGTGVPAPVTITFSIPWTMAVTALAGKLSPDELDPAWLEKNAAELRALADRVRLTHDPELTLAASERFALVLPPVAVLKDAGSAALVRGIARMRRDHPGVRLSGRDLRALGSGMVAGWRAHRRDATPPGSTEGFAMALPATVIVTRRDRTRVERTVMVPRGAAGSPVVGPHEVASEKLHRWGPRLWGPRTSEIDAAIAHDDPGLHALL